MKVSRLYGENKEKGDLGAVSPSRGKNSRH